jgi:hypothetical protein
MADDAPVMVERPRPDPRTELFRVLNAFQHSPGFGVYVCERFRDPRRFLLDDYFDEVEGDAVGVDDLARRLGRGGFCVRPQERKDMLSLAGKLESLAGRIRGALE